MPTLFILDPNLKNLLGHYFEYDRSVAEAARRKGLRPIVLSHRDAALPAGLPFDVHPVYSADIWMCKAGVGYHSRANITAASGSFADETNELFLRCPPVRDDIVFIPTITKAQLPGVATLAAKLEPVGARLKVLLRYQKSFYDGDVAAEAFRRLEQAAATTPISLCTDSHRLAQEFRSLTTLPVEVLPIPHTDRLNAFGARARDEAKAVHFVSLGNAREEKGFAEILKAVRRSARMPWADRVRFTLQCNDPCVGAIGAVDEFKRTPDPRVRLVDRILGTDEYYALLGGADVVLLPYHRSIYTERTSGIFLEALAAGKPVICTRDTWMSDLLDVHGAGIAVDDRSPGALCEAIGEVASRISELAAKAGSAGSHWKDVHSPDNLVAHLMDDAGKLVTIRRSSRAAVIYPWGDAASGRSGAVARLRLFVKHLESRYGEVRVLFPAQGQPAGYVTERTVAEPFEYLTVFNKILYGLLEVITRMLGGKKGQSFHLWYHLWPRFNRRFHNRSESIIRWADDVYLEYSYFAPVVAPLCRQFGRRWTLTQYDIVSEQAKPVPMIYPAARALEFAALRSAPRVIVCSNEDRLRCAEQGIVAEVIAHPVDLGDKIELSPEEAEFILGSLCQVQIQGRKVCFFVGSSYEPNRRAARFISSLAAQMQSDPRAKDVLFVVVGACMSPHAVDNFIAIGSVEDAVLSACYAMTDIVLVPLTEGTGSSIKSIEALGHGAVVLSTSIGMRGIPVENGRHCIIEDDFSRYGEHIIEIIGDPERASVLRQAAVEFAASYDFRRAFAPYLDAGDDACLAPKGVTGAIKGKRIREDAFSALLPRAQQLSDPAVLAFIRDRLGSQVLIEQADLGGDAPADQTGPMPDPSQPVCAGDNRMKVGLTKSIALRIPQIRRLYEQRNALLLRVEELEVHRDGLLSRMKDFEQEQQNRQ